VNAPHIVALGARTPVGLSVDSSMAAVRAGIDQFAEHEFFIDRTGEPVRTARDALLDPGLVGPKRLIDMGETALQQVCQQLVAYSPNLGQIPLLLALPQQRPGWTSSDSQTVSTELGNREFSLDFEIAELYPYGHAAGLAALYGAVRKIEAGQTELCVIAGVDSYLEPDTLGWLDQNKQLATTYNRGAFFPGEGAGAIAVASDSAVRRLGLNSLVKVRGIGAATESNLIKTDTVCIGEGLTAAVKQAIEPLSHSGVSVDGIICDINGERYRGEEWGFTLLRVSKTLSDPTDYEQPSSCWGDVGAASGPLFIALAASAGNGGWGKGSHYLIWNSSEAGQRTAAVLEISATNVSIQ